MMNVGIIFYAAGQLSSSKLLNVATQHCLTTRRYLVRGDGSTAHEGIFDLQSGQFLRASTQQGWRADSCWARGLAWAIYGFSSAYQHTRTMGVPDPRFLETAEAVRAVLPRPRPAARRPAQRFRRARPLPSL